MSKFYKKLNKYTKSYKKKIMNGEFTEEEKLVFLTIGLSTINSLIYFVGGIKEASSDYAGFNTKAWGTSLKNITEVQVHQILEEVTHEYLSSTYDTSTTTLDKRKLSNWMIRFQKHTKGCKAGHLVDRVFPFLFLEEAVRNEMPVMTFVTIFDNMFFRLDVQLDRALKELYGEKSVPTNV